MKDLILNNLNELKGALENCTNDDLLKMREEMLNLVIECLETEEA